jgi:hypothetical protein
MQTLSRIKRKARTGKECKACLLPIQPGQRYWDERSVHDEAPYAWPHHLWCRFLMEDELREYCFNDWEQWYEEGCVAVAAGLIEGDIDYEAVLQGKDKGLHHFAAWLKLYAEWRQEEPDEA